MKYDLYAIGQRALNARLNKNIQQKEISQTLGISQATYSRFENGQCDMPLSLVMKLCDYLGVSVSWLINEDNVPRLTDNERLELEKYKHFLISQRKK